MKIKALAAAVALMSTASVANATWHDGYDSDGFTFDGELLLVAYDDVRKVSVVQDLGGTYSEFLTNINNAEFTKSFTLDPLVAQTFAGSAASDVRYTVYANGYDEFLIEHAMPGFLTTTNTVDPVVTSAQSFAHQSKVDAGISVNVNGALPNGLDGDFSENGAFYGDLLNGLYFGDNAYFGNNLNITVNLDTTAASNESAYFWAFLDGVPVDGSDGADLKFVGTWSMNIAGNEISYSAVPVPAAIWLLGSGLLGLGAISRRRKA